MLLLGHAVLITTGYALADDRSLPDQVARLIEQYPGVITAIAGLVLLLGVVVSSVVIVRRRLRYETWYFVHLYAYLAVALAFSHQLATGTAFVGEPLARAYWTGLYVATLAAILGFRLVLPVARSLRHDLRVERVVEEAPGVVSVMIGGRRLDRLGARTGQFFLWRFLTRDRWWEAHPFSLSAAPDGLPAADHGQGRRRLHGPAARHPAGHARDRRGPVRRLHDRRPAAPARGADRRRRRHHADPRAARGHARRARRHRRRLPGAAAGGRDPARRARRAGAPARRRAALRRRRPPRGRAALARAPPARSSPTSPLRDVYVCGPPAMTEATRATLSRSGVPRRQIVTERFAY